MHKVKTWSIWVYWKYIGCMALIMSMPAWPWVLFQFHDNIQSGCNMFLLNWHREPIKNDHTQFLMHGLAQNFKRVFDFALECIEKQ